MRTLRWVGTGMLVMLMASACSVESPEGLQGSEPALPSPIVEPDDPVAELDGRAVAGLATGGPDVVLRVGANGFRLPEDERILDVQGDRVLSARGVVGGGIARLIVRDLEGDPVREFDPEMQLPQAAIVRGDDVYFGGIDLHEDADGFPVATDRGAWVARGDAPPEPIVAPTQEQARYQAIERSPDGRTVGVTRCGETACSTFQIGPAGHVVEVPEPLLIALTQRGSAPHRQVLRRHRLCDPRWRRAVACRNGGRLLRALRDDRRCPDRHEHPRGRWR